MRTRSLFAALALLTVGAGPAWADAPAATAGPEPESGLLGLNLDLGLHSAYLFRGYNVFQEDSQLDPHMLVAPGVLWTVGDTGLALGYLGSFQATGGNIGDVLDVGLGGEQDLYATYMTELGGGLSVGGLLTAYLYPFADKDLTGSGCPLYLEPGVKVAWSNVVDLSLTVAYFYGVQDEPAIRGISYLYVNPVVATTVALADGLDLGLKLSYGFKLFKEGNDGMSNVHDLALVANLPINVTDTFYVTPAVTLGWTNIEGKDFGDGLAVVGGVNLGVNL